MLLRAGAAVESYQPIPLWDCRREVIPPASPGGATTAVWWCLPSQGLIAPLAEKIWVGSGRPAGTAERDWLLAETSLIAWQRRLH
jgi:hypothetical protein